MSTGTAQLDALQLDALLASAADDSADPQRCGLILQRGGDRLVALARRMLRAYPHLQRWEDTEDVFQEAAFRLYQSVRELKPRSVEELFALAVLQIRRTLIDLARHHFGPLGQAAHYRSDPSLALQSRCAASAARRGSSEPQSLAEWAEFHEAVGNLPPPQRQVFELVWYAGASYGEVAELMGVTRRTVIRRMNGARLRLEGVVVEREWR